MLEDKASTTSKNISSRYLVALLHCSEIKVAVRLRDSERRVVDRLDISQTQTVAPKYIFLDSSGKILTFLLHLHSSRELFV